MEAMLAWVDWFNTRRFLESIGDLPSAKYEARNHDQLKVI